MVLDDVVVESELNDGDVADLAERFADMVDKELVDIEAKRCCCDNIDCDDVDDITELKFPCRVTCEDDDEDPIDLELSVEALNMILDKSNEDNCSFNDAFSGILQEGLKLIEDVINDEKDDEPEKDPFEL